MKLWDVCYDYEDAEANANREHARVYVVANNIVDAIKKIHVQAEHKCIVVYRVELKSQSVFA